MFPWEIMSWLFKNPNHILFKDLAVIILIMKKSISWLFKDPIVIVAQLNFEHAQSNSKKWPKD